MKRAILFVAFAALCGAQTTVNGGRDYKGTLKASGSVSAVDFSGAGGTAPAKAGTSASRPTACTQGQIYFATDAAAGQNLYFCTATGAPGVWTQMSGATTTTTTAGTGAPSGNCTPPVVYIDTTNQDLWFCGAANSWKRPTADTSGLATLAGLNTWTGYSNLSGGQWRPPESTVANLPSAAGNVGKVFMVTDAATAGSCSTGGGTLRELCRADGSAYECVGGCGFGGGGGGSGTTAYISFLISGPDSTRTIAGATHGFATSALLVAVYDSASPRNAISVGWSVNPTTHDVTIAFASPQSDYYVVINGGAGAVGATGPTGTAGAAGATGAAGQGVPTGGSTGQVLQKASNTTYDTAWASSAAEITSMTTGATDPVASCTAPSTSNLLLYTQTTTQDLWACVATNTWKKVLSTNNTGAYTATGAVGTAPSNPASGYVTCYYSSVSLTQICLDASGNVFSAVKTAASRTANQFVTHVPATGIPATAAIVAADIPAALTSTTSVNGTSIPSSATLATKTGTTPTNNCAKWDSSGNLIDSGGTCGGGSGVTNVATSAPLTGGPITGTGTIGLDTTKVVQKWFGTAAPGSVAGNLPGDIYVDTTGHGVYICNAPSGTAAPACTSVATAGWIRQEPTLGNPDVSGKVLSSTTAGVRSWTAAGTGDVAGPASSTDDHIPQFSGTTGKTLKDGLTVATSVGTPGVDTSVPTEKAVRDALASAGGPFQSAQRFAQLIARGISTQWVNVGTGISTSGTITGVTVDGTWGPTADIASTGTTDARAEVYTDPMFRSGRNLKLQVEAGVVQTASGTARTVIGFMESQVATTGSDLPAEGVNYAAFRYTRGTDTNWVCMANDGSVSPASADSGVAVTVAPFTFGIIEDDTAVTTKWYINGSQVCTGLTSKRLGRNTTYTAAAVTRTLENVAKNLRVGWINVASDR